MVRCGLAVCLQWVASSSVVVESLRGGEASAKPAGKRGVTGCVTKRRRGQGRGTTGGLTSGVSMLRSPVPTPNQ